MGWVVADPSVLVSAIILRSGHPATIWRAVLDGRIELVLCPRLLAELAGVLERPKFRRYVGVDEAESFVAEVARYGRRFPDPTDPPSASRDPDERLFVKAARDDKPAVEDLLMRESRGQ